MCFAGLLCDGMCCFIGAQGTFPDEAVVVPEPGMVWPSCVLCVCGWRSCARHPRAMCWRCGGGCRRRGCDGCCCGCCGPWFAAVGGCEVVVASGVPRLLSLVKTVWPACDGLLVQHVCVELAPPRSPRCGLACCRIWSGMPLVGMRRS